MKKAVLAILFASIITSCATTNRIAKDAEVSLKFLDEHVIPGDLMVNNTKVGGLSNIDYDAESNTYYFIVDVPKQARFYQASIPISNQKIDTIVFKQTTFIDTEAPFFKAHTLDPESIRFLPQEKEFVITSEGSINYEKDPSIFEVNMDGSFKDAFEIPSYFKATGEQKPRHNGVFEGLAASTDQKGFWVATELPLTKDGAKPKLFPTRSYARITYYDKDSKKATKQFAYKLDGISKIPWKYFAVNGITELLEYKKDHFLVLERAYSAGHGSHGNTVKIFEVDASQATNTVNEENLKKVDYTPASKKLLFDFKSVKNELTDKVIDNIEGMCFGPVLPNGKQSLLLVSDNNFNSFADQLTQVFLFEIDIQ
ncbi:Uncharacterized conserved protein [Pustulibacterium marinum]|uniref:Uncharacterized conserved protein n=1 Tax=Pustulibacterium marinum TaxID=1224947 RepID=A0A1I7IUN6_9FLAO|nr:esterase-like activity of phytase family protein [Pustulibacterium marinum]SFU76611.1 Uncharacterized conserved protein [Pustulibacterium marinum]